MTRCARGEALEDSRRTLAASLLEDSETRSGLEDSALCLEARNSQRNWRRVGYCLGWVYAITDGRHIKVGFSKNSGARLWHHQTSNAMQLSILGEIALSQQAETQLLKELRAIEGAHVRGEWFHKSEAVEAVLKSWGVGGE